jgi:hypothetical protein
MPKAHAMPVLPIVWHILHADEYANISYELKYYKYVKG